jgi:hypothetical protein
VEVERKWKREDYRLPGTPPELVQISTSNGHKNAGSVSGGQHGKGD